MHFTLRQIPKYYSKVKNKSACFWNRFPLRLKVILHGTILNATRITALLQHCSKQQRCVAMKIVVANRTLSNITLIDPGHASIAFPRNRELIQGG